MFFFLILKLGNVICKPAVVNFISIWKLESHLWLSIYMQILLQKTKKRHEVHIVCFNHLGVAALFAPFSILSETTCTNLSMQDWFCLNIPTKQYLLVLLNISLSYPFLQQVLKNSNWINLNKVSSWRKKFHCTHFLPCENFSEIAARSRRESRRDRGAFLAAEISRISPRSRQDFRKEHSEFTEIFFSKLKQCLW